MGNTNQGERTYSGLPEYYLISGGESRDMIVWDTKDLDVCHKIKGAHDNSICDIVKLGDDKHVVTSSFDSKIKVWDIKNMKRTRTLKGHKDAVRKLCILGDLCLSASKDNTVKIWNMTNGQLVDTYLSYCTGVSDIKCIDSNTIATTNNTTIRLWDVNKKKIFQSFKHHIDWVISLEYDKEKDILFSASWDRKICLWDPRVRGLLAKPLATIENMNQINCMLYAPMKDWVLVGDQGGCISIYDMRILRSSSGSSSKLNKKKLFKSIGKNNPAFHEPIVRDQPHSEVVFKLCWMEEHKFASCAADNTIRLYDLTKLTATGYVLRDKDPITTIMFFPDPDHHVDNYRKIKQEKKKTSIKLQEGRFEKFKNLDIEGIFKVWKVLSKKKFEKYRVLEEKISILKHIALLLHSENKKGLVHENLDWNHVKIDEDGKVKFVVNAVPTSDSSLKTMNNMYAFGVMMYTVLYEVYYDEVEDDETDSPYFKCSCDREKNKKKKENEEYDYHAVGRNCSLYTLVSKNAKKYPKILVNLIKKCWNEDLRKRPSSFEKICKVLMNPEIIKEYREKTSSKGGGVRRKTGEHKNKEEEEEEENEGEEEEQEDNNIVDTYLEKKEYSKVVSILSKSIEKSTSSVNPNQYDLLYKRGKGYHGMREFSKAVEDYSKSMQLKPPKSIRSEIYYCRALSNYSLGEFQKAVEDCSRSIEVFGEVGETEEKKKEEEEEEDKKFKITDIYYRKGRSYQQLEVFEKAIENFTKAMELSKNDDDISLYLHFRGQTYFEAEEPKKAINDFTAAIEKQPNNFLHYEGRGETFHDMKKYKKAVEDYTKSIEIDPVKGTGYRLRASVYVDTKEFKKALEDIGKASEIHPNEVDYWLFRIEILLELKEYQKVVGECTVVIENMDMNEPSWFMSRGIAWFHLEGYENAQRDAKKAKALDDEQEVFSDEERSKLEKLLKDIKRSKKK